MSWHDCHIWGVDLRAGNADEGDWTSIAQIERRPVDNQKVFLDRPITVFESRPIGPPAERSRSERSGLRKRFDPSQRSSTTND